MKAKGESRWPADQVERRAVADLVPYARNARTHSAEQVDQIAASIREWGWTVPVLIDESGTLIAGHGRIMAAKKLGIEEVPVMVARGWSEAKRRAYVIADNRLALSAGWDSDMLAAEIGELLDDDFDVDLLGFDQAEIDDLIGEIAAPMDGADVADDETPEPQEAVVSRTGDVWLLGRHRVMCGSSLDSADMTSLVGDGEAVDMWLTDPPCNIAYEGKTDDALTIQNDNMGDGKFREFLSAACRVAHATLKQGASFYIWHAPTEAYNFNGAARDVGLVVRQTLVWVKQKLVFGRQDYHWKHESCLYGWKGGAAHYWGSDRKQTTVLEFDRPGRSENHPTMKPVDMFAYLMGNSTRRGDIVLDSFGGSGTTLIAAEQLGRSARVMELDPKYVDVIVRRWQSLTGQEAILESAGETFATVQCNRGS